MDERTVFSEKNGEIQQGIRLIRDSWIINIEITNSCKVKCSNCTRATKHIRNPFFISLDFLDKALNSLKDWPKGIGIIGGEPQGHPQWNEICRHLKEFNHKGGYALFTSREFNGDRSIFDKIYITDHSIKNLHHPLLISLEEVVEPELHRELIEKCWLQRLWSPSISPKGGFWCEIAGVLDLMWNGPGGYDVAPGWWKRESYEDQINLHCKRCGICIPVGIETDKEQYELITPKVLERLKGMHSPCLNSCKLYTEKLSNETIKLRQDNMVSLCYIFERTKKEQEGLYF